MSVAPAIDLNHVAFGYRPGQRVLEVSPILTALVAAVLGGVVIELLRMYGGTAGDQALALVFYTGSRWGSCSSPRRAR